MVNEVDLLVCDDCEIILLGEGESHVCMNCEKPMHYAKFMRQPIPRAADVLITCAHCGNYHSVYIPCPSVTAQDAHR